MSRKLNQNVAFWKDVDRVVRRTPYSFDFPITRHDRDTVSSVAALWSILLYDASLSDFLDSRRRILRWIDFTRGIGFLTAIADCKRIAGYLINESQMPVHSNYEHFKRAVSAVFPNCAQLLAPVKELVDLWFRNRDPEDFRRVLTCCVFPSRMSLRKRRDLEDSAQEAFLLDEIRVSEQRVIDGPDQILREWFPRRSEWERKWRKEKNRRDRELGRVSDYIDIPPHPFVLFNRYDPWHGPGSVADAKQDLFSKFCSMRSDKKLHFILSKVDQDRNVLPRGFQPGLDRTARSLVVPKSFDKLRTIAMEPTSLQWVQQGFREALMIYIASHPLLRERIDLSKPELNCELAFEGSIDGSYSTIDLSSASDSVGRELVRKWFKNTALREILQATRSNKILTPGGERLETSKFAPMGSSLCFPVECLVFAAITEHSIKACGGDPSTSRYRVYGDDIIVETEYVETVMHVLDSCGFLLNRDKSFFRSDTESFYRESCGGEYLDGHDVTPFRLSRKFDGLGISKDTPDRIERVIEMANSAIEFPSLRLYLISQFMKLPYELRPPFSLDGEVGVWSSSCTQWHLPLQYYDEDLQLTKFLCGTPVSRPSDHTDCSEDVRLFAHLRYTVNRDILLFPENRVEINVLAPKEPSWIGQYSILDGSYHVNTL